jgi:hypothetical protein
MGKADILDGILSHHPQPPVRIVPPLCRRWCKKFAASFSDRLRRRRPRPGDKWHMDEVFIRIQGVQHYLWRAVDQDGVVLDQARRWPRQRRVSSNGC